ncbi:uncharacterized protein HaLaN_19402, partial [Haematococcus lacustris]
MHSALYRFTLYSDPQTWHAARSICDAQNGTLATFRSAGEYSAVSNALASSLTAVGWAVWMGASATAMDSVWTWVDGDRLVWSNWDASLVERPS